MSFPCGSFLFMMEVGMKKLKITAPPKPARTSPKAIRAKPFDVDELLKHVDPGTPEEAEEFVRTIYDLRRQDRDSQVPQ